MYSLNFKIEQAPPTLLKIVVLYPYVFIVKIGKIVWIFNFDYFIESRRFMLT